MRVVPSRLSRSQGRVALVVPRWTDKDDPGPQGVPFRCFTLGAGLCHAGFDVVFFDAEHDLDRDDRFDELLGELQGARAVFVWMNELYPSNQCHNAEAIAARLKRSRPDLPVVVGGEFISICPPEFFDIETAADFFLQGYGEESAPRLLAHLAAGTEPDDVAGLIWREQGGRLRHQPVERRQRFHPGLLDFFRQIDLAPYIQIGGVLGNDQPTLTIATGRGCTKGCGFCAWSKHPAKILGAEPTFALMRDLAARYGVRQFHIGELDFFMSRQRALGLAQRIAAHGGGIGWFALGSPIDLIRYSEEDWDVLRAGGLLKVELGSESGSARTLRAIGKRHTPEDIVAVTERMLTRGIVPMNNFLFGFPGETREDRQQTLRVIDRLARLPYRHNHFTYRYYQPVWGTPLGDRAHAAIPARPRRLDGYLRERPRFHADGCRTMHWLAPRDEREIKQLINHDLPLATSDQVFDGRWQRWLYERLRGRARRGVREGRGGSRLDRWLWQSCLARTLDQTYVA